MGVEVWGYVALGVVLFALIYWLVKSFAVPFCHWLQSKIENEGTL